MEDVNFTRFALAFIFVIALIGCMAFVLKRVGSKQKWLGMNEKSGRLQIVESRFLDARRRLVLVKRDNKEYLLLLGEGRELVIESGIKPPMIDNDTDVLG